MLPGDFQGQRPGMWQCMVQCNVTLRYSAGEFEPPAEYDNYYKILYATFCAFISSIYLNRGFEFQLNPYIDGGGICGNYKTTYFSVPLLACYEVGKTIKVYGYGGLYLNFLTDSKNKITVTSDTPTLKIYDYSYDPKDEFYKTEAGLVG
ncbi:MAG: PorT family protein, partial [Chlorobi bacterium]|nr:PorT family protein [Chlorobiota bacterium]